MVSKIRFLVAIDMLFLLLLALSGSASGITSEILYYLAFLAPVGLTLNYIYSPDKNTHVSADELRSAMLKDLKGDFSLSKENALLTLPLIIPAISLIFALSFLTSLFMGFLGYENGATFDKPFIIALIIHALIPAILEELLFRFAPIKLLSDNKKSAFLVSSVLFAFAHANLFQIPYALLAGMIFSGIYLMTGSIFPTVIIHFLNNSLSLISIYGYFKAPVYISVSVLLALSLVFIYLRRRTYIKKLKNVFPNGEKMVFSRYPFFFIATSLILAISMLFA